MVYNFWNRLILLCEKFRNAYLFTGMLLVGCILGSIMLVDFSMIPDNYTDLLSLSLDTSQTNYHLKDRLLSFITAIIFLILGFSQILLSLENLIKANLWKALLPLIFGAFLVIIGRAFCVLLLL
ncbi:TPA: hypothetical protein QC445_005617 [Bacillus cereus]|nr:hypothetical protein [Bacillus cereus]